MMSCDKTNCKADQVTCDVADTNPLQLTRPITGSGITGGMVRMFSPFAPLSLAPQSTSDFVVEDASLLQGFAERLVDGGDTSLQLATELAALDTAGLAARDRLKKAASASFATAGDMMLSAGERAFVADWGALRKPLKKAAVVLDDLASALLAAPASADDMLARYASAFGGMAAALRTVASGSQKRDQEFSSASATLLQHASLSLASLDAAWAISTRYGTDIPAHLLLDDCGGCPLIGCTSYCTDVLLNRISRTGAVSRWRVRSTTKQVCCCYADAWDLFWATNCCDKAISISVPVVSVKRFVDVTNTLTAGDRIYC